MCKSSLLLLLVCLFQTSCNAQPNDGASTHPHSFPNAEACDGCEEIFTGMPIEISAVDTSPGWHTDEIKLLITGTVFQLDGLTPAPNTLIYYYHTDGTGRYPTRKNETDVWNNHGAYRGWVRSDAFGKYAIFTSRPAPYPDLSTPAHIHILIIEDRFDFPYFLDDFVFDDDVLTIAAQKKKPFENRGGSGILRPLLAEQMQIAEHNIILGLNIPNYPSSVHSEKTSGSAIGEVSPSFMPFHAWGPDRGERVCPICKYGRFHGILYFIGNNPDWSEIKSWLQYLEKESVDRQNYLKVVFVYGNENNYGKAMRESELAKIGEELNIKNTALTFVPSLHDQTSEVHLFKINSAVENTFIIYRHRDIIGKFIDLKANEDNFKRIALTLDQTQSEFNDLQEVWRSK
ncbi:MAG: intradiol ring-cleavage dioxygenase [Bacteroidia bacterium]